jgi:hypothetical protein
VKDIVGILLGTVIGGQLGMLLIVLRSGRK